MLMETIITKERSLVVNESDGNGEGDGWKLAKKRNWIPKDVTCNFN